MTQLKCMFDTNVFNRILDGIISIEALQGCVDAYATHIQRDEIDKTRNPERRSALARIFREFIKVSTPTDSFVIDTSRIGEARIGGDRVVPTTSAVWDVSRWDEARWSTDVDLYPALKAELDKRNNCKENNIQDALIAETSIKEDFVLVTDDSDLVSVTRKYGGKCLTVAELKNRVNED